ncbi:hypothetical protein LY76DRAFT_656169 [Colletotrichum caudatum]|nr:hypothetical protein LY76DRAFT_656169 [Colletotrichum caudatum]
MASGEVGLGLRLVEDVDARAGNQEHADEEHQRGGRIPRRAQEPDGLVAVPYREERRLAGSRGKRSRRVEGGQRQQGVAGGGLLTRHLDDRGWARTSYSADRSRPARRRCGEKRMARPPAAESSTFGEVMTLADRGRERGSWAQERALQGGELQPWHWRPVERHRQQDGTGASRRTLRGVRVLSSLTHQAGEEVRNGLVCRRR